MRLWGLMLGLMGLVAGCGGPKPFVKENFLEHAPASVAVLPFVITYPYDASAGEEVPPPSHRVGRDLFRKSFYYGLTPYGFHDRKLVEVDELLSAGWGPLEAAGWREASPQLLGEALDAEALIYGDIHRIIFVATPLYTEASVDATLRMVSASTGEELWRQHVVAAERGGALVQKGQVVDFIQDQARSYDASIKFQRLCDIAVRDALNEFPNPPLPEAGAGTHEAAVRPVRLAVLPLDAREKKAWQEPAEMLRGHLSANLQEGPFEIIEPARVDAALAAAGWQPGRAPTEEEASAAARAVGADALLRGGLTEWGRSYWVVQSWVRAGLQLELVDVATGNVVWSEQRKNSRSAGLLKGPTGLKSLATSPLSGLKRSNLERVARNLARDLAQHLNTAPSIIAYVNEQFATAQASRSGS